MKTLKPVTRVGSSFFLFHSDCKSESHASHSSICQNTGTHVFAVFGYFIVFIISTPSVVLSGKSQHPVHCSTWFCFMKKVDFTATITQEIWQRVSVSFLSYLRQVMKTEERKMSCLYIWGKGSHHAMI